MAHQYVIVIFENRKPATALRWQIAGGPSSGCSPSRDRVVTAFPLPAYMARPQKRGASTLSPSAPGSVPVAGVSPHRIGILSDRPRPCRKVVDLNLDKVLGGGRAYGSRPRQTISPAYLSAEKPMQTISADVRLALGARGAGPWSPLARAAMRRTFRAREQKIRPTTVERATP